MGGSAGGVVGVEALGLRAARLGAHGAPLRVGGWRVNSSRASELLLPSCFARCSRMQQLRAFALEGVRLQRTQSCQCCQRGNSQFVAVVVRGGVEGQSCQGCSVPCAGCVGLQRKRCVVCLSGAGFGVSRCCASRRLSVCRLLRVPRLGPRACLSNKLPCAL